MWGSWSVADASGVPPSDEASEVPEEGAGELTGVSVEEQLHALQRGDLEAGYALLGRQASVARWRQALSILAGRPSEVDLETVAHRTLRRPPDVVSGLLDVAKAASTAEAAFVAKAVAGLRDEAPLRERAEALRTELLALNDYELKLAEGDGVEALRSIISLDLPRQRAVAADASADAAVLDVLRKALDSEYQRLLELARIVRWTRGSYRYFLRHALADFALLAGFGGRTEDLAYRLLQQEVDHPEDNLGVLDELPSSTRSRFLNWALQRENANQHPARTQVALRVAGEHLDEVARDALLDAAAADDRVSSLAAIELAIRQNPSDAKVDARLAELLNACEDAVTLETVIRVLETASERLRVDLLSPEKRTVIIAKGEGLERLGPRYAVALAAAADNTTRLALATELGEVRQRAAVPDETLEAALATLVFAEPRIPSHALGSLFEDSGFRSAGWRLLPTLTADRQSELFKELLAKDTPQVAGERAAELVAVSDVLLDEILDGIEAGQVDPASTATTPPDALRRITAAAEPRIGLLESKAAELRETAREGEPASEMELRRLIRPIVELAAERAEGNERLRNDYTRLLPPSDSTVEGSDQVGSLPAELIEELAGVGATVDAADPTGRLLLAPSADLSQVLRFLALLERRSGSQSEELRPVHQRAMEQLVEAMAADGSAQQALTDLFEGGPQMRAVLGLSPATRTILLRTALAHGLAIRPTWLDHRQLGSWLREFADEDSGPVAEPSQTLRRLREARAARDAAAEVASRVQHSAKLSFVDKVSTAFADLERTIDGYVQLWQRLGRLGIDQVAPLGAQLAPDELDPERHELIGDDEEATTWVVRSAGLVIDQQVITKARLEPRVED
jgi:hypothetical protein